MGPIGAFFFIFFVVTLISARQGISRRKSRKTARRGAGERSGRVRQTPHGKRSFDAQIPHLQTTRRLVQPARETRLYSPVKGSR